MIEATADTALVRAVPDSFAHALRGESGPALDPHLARRQHGAYLALLDAAGYAVVQLPADEHYPDCVFIEDTAVTLGPMAIITHCAAPSRRGEADVVRDALSARFTVETIESPGTLDGGDVMQLDGALYVGRSARTNEDGIAQLAAIAAPLGVQPTIVEVHDGLHLKSVVLPVDENTVLVTPNSVDETALQGLRILHEDESERHRASTLPLRDGRLIVTASAPVTAAMLARAGYEVAAIDVSELQAADGGLTCLSILFQGSLPVEPDLGQDEQL
jgi:dimethylargininase